MKLVQQTNTYIPIRVGLEPTPTPNTVELSLCNRIRRAATLCRRGKNKFIVGMGMPTYSLIQQY